MKKQTNFYYYFSLVSILLLTNCDKIQAQKTSMECIKNQNTFAFPWVVSGGTNKEETPPPSAIWEEIVNFNQTATDFIQILEFNEALWINGQELIRFPIKNGDVNTFANTSQFKPSYLFIFNDHLWSVGRQFINSNEPGHLSINQYDQLSEVFNEVINIEEILGENNLGLGKALFSDDKVFLKIENKQRNWKLVAIDLRTTSLILDYSPNGSMSNLTRKPDGSFWFIDENMEGRNSLMVYSSITGDVKEYEPSKSFSETYGNLLFEQMEDMPTTLFFDQNNRLWLDSKGFLDMNNLEFPIWHEIFTGPEFLAENILPEKRYSWSKIFSITETDGEIYWFNTTGGVVKLDFDTGEWCKFTTARGNVLEDERGDLWLLANGVLYKYKQ